MTSLTILEKSFNRIEDFIIQYIYKKYINIDSEYTKFLHTILNYDRKCIITQLEYLELDLNNIDINNHRCSFIRKHKNKYKRCLNKILNNNEDMCYLHISSNNIYLNIYNDIIKDYKSNINTI